ncbi:MAG: septal ring lytic transglycosylase RlpA family protein [Bacteroidetes bacterium]|nr:MAG: septal ring lytic transglycosylase RlpA family protein [Bacteroidota bacterium]
MKRLITLGCLLVGLAVHSFAQKTQYGQASYYHDKFHGTKTASGETYNKNDLTAAHKTLPFGTMVKVTRLDNNKSVTVRINDRGPFDPGRIIDLSRRAAEEIGLIQDGVARVKVEVVSKPAKKSPKTDTRVTTYSEEPKKISTSPAPKDELTPRGGSQPSSPAKTQTSNRTSEASKQTSGKAVLVTQKNYQPTGLFKIQLEMPTNKGYGVQVSAFSQQEGLFREIARLQGMSFKDIFVMIESDDFGVVNYKVILGNFDTRDKAENYKRSLAKRYKLQGFVVDLGAR